MEQAEYGLPWPDTLPPCSCCADMLEVDAMLGTGKDDDPLMVVAEVRDEGKNDMGLFGRTGVVGINMNC